MLLYPCYQAEFCSRCIINFISDGAESDKIGDFNFEILFYFILFIYLFFFFLFQIEIPRNTSYAIYISQFFWFIR